jgi:radical SAM superfamily enzyme YgiQ (UPF0313 family)
MGQLEPGQSIEASSRHSKDRSSKPPDLKVCLVTALTVADFVDPELTENARTLAGPQLGVLALAAILREHGFQPHVMNLDELFIDFLRDESSRPTNEPDPRTLSMPALGGRDQRGGQFFSFAAENLKPQSFNVFGFSSICSSYPLTLRLAAEIKRLNPGARVILGGPQASVVDVSTMRAFTYIDFVVRGEADETLPTLLNCLSSRDGDESWSRIPGITFRRDDEVVRNPNANVVHDLDRLPLAAFDLDREIKNRWGVHLEIGRGCPFACTFCSTNDFFRRNFRLKSPRKMLEQMRRIHQEYGLSYFSLVHDMYTVDRKKVVAFCEALLQSGAGFTWGCSARTDCIDDDLIGLMARAGCRGIFFGIETGSKRLQYAINKRLDLLEAKKRIECADGHGIDIAVALITGFPDECRDDLRDTVHFFVDSLRYEHAEPQLSLLAPLAATPIYEQHKDELVFDHIFSDMSHQGWRQDPADIEMIQAYPEIFPNFYAVPTTRLDREYLKEVRDFVTYVATWFRWLPVALLQDSGDFLRVFDGWREWRQRRSAEESEDTGIVPYYSHRKFRAEFLEFVRIHYLEGMAKARLVIETLLRTEGIPEAAGRRRPSEMGENIDHFEPTVFPHRSANLLVLDLEVDYKELIDSLRTGRDLTEVSERDVTVVLLPTADGRVQVWQLAPLSRIVLRLCDGRRTVEEITQEFSLTESGVGGVPAEKVCLFALMLLKEQGFIALASRPVVAGEDGNSEPAERHIVPRYAPSADMANTQQPWPPGKWMEKVPAKIG